MIAHRRFAPLIVCVVMAFFGLLIRLYQVQIEEHEVWAREADKMVRSVRTIPYLRGKILDRTGDVFVKDEEAYAVRFVYREFRRRHPLGQVAHARSALENQSVDLQLALLELEPWAMALIEARAEALEAFGRGQAVELYGLSFPEVQPGQERRRSRASELRFYTRGLLGVSYRDWNAIKKKLRKSGAAEATWLELVAQQEGSTVDAVRERVRSRISRSIERLEQLAVQMGVRSRNGLIAVTAEESLWFLIEGLELKRREIESAIGKDLFEEAMGFEPGRIVPGILLEMIDLSFIAGELNWGDARLQEWAFEMRAVWLADRSSFHVPRAIIRAHLREDRGEEALDAFLGELAVLFARKPRTPRERRGASREWRGVDDAAVFVELRDLFEGVEFEPDDRAPLAFLEDEWRRPRERGLAREELVAGMLPFEFAARVAREHPPEVYLDSRGDEHEPWSAPETLEDAVARVLWQLYPPSGEAEDTPHADPSRVRDEDQLLPWVQDLWEARFQERLSHTFSELKRAAEAQDFPLPLVPSERRLKRAHSKADYFIRDRGSRPEVLDKSPDDRVVNTLTRYVDEYRGFEVEPRTRRLAMALDAAGLLVARELIGVVRESTLEEVLRQQAERDAFSRILSQKDRSAQDTDHLKDLQSRLYRLDEVHGTSGIEGLMDPVLRGTNGFEVNEGLQQRAEGTRSQLFEEKVDGLDVELCLSIELQMAAQRTIEHPYLPSDEPVRDEYWFRNPVGAIVLATVEGEILAAASCPKEPHQPSPNRDGERAYNYERTLRRPWFQPMGSIFKPFVAVYALSRCGLDPGREFDCAMRDSDGAGWRKVHCHNFYGHGALSLVDALRQSCNSYFAQVGEMLESKRRVRELTDIFGLGRPTGVRAVGSGRGLAEVHRIPSLHRAGGFSTTDLNLAGNGLALIEATPVQVARAIAGLATGRLPSMRIVRRAGDEWIPATFEEIPLPEHNLELVRQAMVDVVNIGSARGKGLSKDLLGFQIAGKTGSADYLPMTPDYLEELRIPPRQSRPRMRKHTWFMGFFPAENPTNVVVVYCHDIGVTSTHSAVYVAAQFLKTAEVQAYMKGALR